MSLEDEWNKAKPIDTFDARLIQEGIDPTSHKGATLKAIYSQESSSGKNTNTSNAGAVGGMQIMPNTFNSVANKEWDINNPEHSTRAGIRYGSQLYDANSGDANKTAIGYYGGQNAINKAEQGIAVSDLRNPNAPNTIEYANSITNKMNNAEQDNLKKLWDCHMICSDCLPPSRKQCLLCVHVSGLVCLLVLLVVSVWRFVLLIRGQSLL